MNAPRPSHDSQRIWLTGASSGIGLALAEELLAAGHRLALSARRSGPLQQLSERFPGQVLLVPGDLGEASQVEAIGERIRLHWGALDMAILNAGTCEYVEAADFQAAMVERVLRANLLSAAYCIEAALPLLGLDPTGIIALANVAAERLFPAQAPLIGLDAVSVLPAALLEQLGAAADGDSVDCPELGGRVEVHPLGGSRSTRGTLLTFIRPTQRP